jgi:hypothetical protein
MPTCDADRIEPPTFGGQNALKADIVRPPGEEIVPVEKTLARLETKGIQARGPRQRAVRSIVAAMDAEPVQVKVVPAHRTLHKNVEVGERHVAQNVNPAPDDRLDLAQLNPELVDADRRFARGARTGRSTGGWRNRGLVIQHDAAPESGSPACLLRWQGLSNRCGRACRAVSSAEHGMSGRHWPC